MSAAKPWTYRTERGYRIECNGAAIPTFTVVYVPTNENISHHETAHAARKAAQRYHEADERRRKP